MAWSDLQTYNHMCSVHESNFINISLLLPAHCLYFQQGLMKRCYHKTIFCVAFCQENQAVLDICLLDNGSLSLESFETSSPGEVWSRACLWGGKRSQKKSLGIGHRSGTISQLDFAIWDVERRSAAAHMLLWGRSNVMGEERAKGVSYTKWSCYL